jgi:hypothetical protein
MKQLVKNYSELKNYAILVTNGNEIVLSVLNAFIRIVILSFSKKGNYGLLDNESSFILVSP